MVRAALLALLLAAGAACSHDGHDGHEQGSSGSDPLDEPARQAAAGICAAAAGDDLAGTERAFASVHNQLHDVGDALTAKDRTEAASFLRAKSTVEGDLSGDAPPDKLGADLDALSEALARAFDVLDLPARPC